jgi:hypothetical protein
VVASPFAYPGSRAATPTEMTSVSDDADPLHVLWSEGYSIAELWGHGPPVSRATSAVDAAHLLLWGILSIVEYQVSRGAGHRYLRERLWARDWIAVGILAPKVAESRLVCVPPLKDAKFGRKVSAIGDGATKYTDVRVVTSKFYRVVMPDIAPGAASGIE